MIMTRKPVMLAAAAAFGALAPLSLSYPEATSSAKSTARVSSLNLLDSAVSSVSYSVDGVKYRREVFGKMILQDKK